MANKGRGQGNRGEFRSEQPAIQAEVDYSQRLSKWDEKYHEYHSRQGQGQTKKNPLFDLRMTPQKRFEKFLDSEYNKFGNNIEAAIDYAEQVFEQQGEGIAGDWNDEGGDQQSGSSSGNR